LEKMGKESEYFGSPSWTPRERLVLKMQHLSNLAGEAFMRWRYRDRLHIGEGARIDPWTVKISGPGAVEMEEGVIIERGLYKVCFHLGPESKVKIGARTWIQTFDGHTTFSTKKGARIDIGEDCWFSGGLFGASKLITVGKRTLIGWGCMILDSNMHRMDNDSPPVDPLPVEIGSNVWMPSYITVLKGVKIGDNCVIGTGSLVNRDIPANSFAAGRPAKVIKRISDRDQVE